MLALSRSGARSAVDLAVRRRRFTLALASAALAAALIGVVLAHPWSSPRTFSAAGRLDPLSFQPAGTQALERDASAGVSHVLYAKSPGGVLESARRTGRYRTLIDAGVDYFIIYLNDLGHLDTLRLLGQEVLPAFRQ